MALEDLYSWLSEHEDVYIITDVKTKNLAALKHISATAGILKKQFIPQIYNLNEFAPVKRLGFKDIVLTLYRLNLSDEKIVEFAAANELFAVTMPLEKAISTSLAEELENKNVAVLVHTVNSFKIWEKLRQKGIEGIYTDVLTVADRLDEKRTLNVR
jgi:glycerophosphoryl diester phosphodiesterase